MRKMSWILIGCSLICIGAYRWGDVKWESAKQKAMEILYIEATELIAPYIHVYGKKPVALVYEDIEHLFMPQLGEFRMTKHEIIGENEENEEIEENEENEMQPSGSERVEEIPPQETIEPNSVEVSGLVPAMEKKVEINRVKLQDFDYLRQNFYQVDNTTTVDSTLLNVTQLLEKDMTLTKNVEGPQILIYHTHSQEGYKDSVPGDSTTTVVGVADYLEQLLEQKYGLDVLHHTGVYDLPKRDNAYSMALPNIEKILQENPTIELVIDLHRDGVAEDRHLVTEINGKQTAKLMFFNGLSRTTTQGELGYLANP